MITSIVLVDSILTQTQIHKPLKKATMMDLHTTMMMMFCLTKERSHRLQTRHKAEENQKIIKIGKMKSPFIEEAPCQLKMIKTKASKITMEVNISRAQIFTLWCTLRAKRPPRTPKHIPL